MVYGSTSWICHGSIKRENTTIIYEEKINNNYRDDIQIACLVILSFILALYLVILFKQNFMKKKNNYENSSSSRPEQINLSSNV